MCAPHSLASTFSTFAAAVLSRVSSTAAAAAAAATAAISCFLFYPVLWDFPNPQKKNGQIRTTRCQL
jgi:hypothetical protein